MKNKEKYLEEFVRKSMIEENGGIDFMKKYGIADYFNNHEPLIVCVGKLLAWFEEECQEPILDEKEKEYLSAVIRPWRDKVISIVKMPTIEHDYIAINHYDEDYINAVALPFFEKGTMYKGMEPSREYSLEELEI